MSNTVVTRHSWGERLGKSFKGIIVGLILFVVAFPVLWMNEHRTINRAKALAAGEKAVVPVACDTVNSDNEGKLIHVSGNLATQETLKDEQFGISVAGIRLKRHVEMLQWRENSHTETKKKAGGSEEETTVYTYEQVWSDTLIDSSNFHTEESHVNPKRMPFQNMSLQAKAVTLGAFSLSERLISLIGGERAMALDNSLVLSGTLNDIPDYSAPFVADNAIYFRAVGPSLIKTVAAGVVQQTAAAAQAVEAKPAEAPAAAEAAPAAEPAKKASTTFSIAADPAVDTQNLTISISGSGSQAPAAEKAEAKPAETPAPVAEAAPAVEAAAEAVAEVAAQAVQTGTMPVGEIRVGDVRVTYRVVLPHEFSIVGQQQGNTFVPYLTKTGEVLLSADTIASADEMFASAKSGNKMIAWLLRLLGFLMMFAGLKMVFKPLAVLGDVLPILGTIIGFGTGLAAAIISFPCALLTIAIAWLFYRPVISVILIAAAVAIVILLKKRKAEAQTN